MRNVTKFFCLVVLSLLLTGCASLVSWISQGGLDQEMRITSDPVGAKVFLMGSIPLGETPLMDIEIERIKNTFLTLKKEGYEDQNLLLKHHFNYWF